MNFEPSPKSRDDLERVQRFMAEHVEPVEAQYWQEVHEMNAHGDWTRWRVHPLVDAIKRAASEAGLKVERSGVFERRGAAIPELGVAPELRADAFTVPAGSLAPKAYAAAGDGIVAVVRERIPTDMSGFAAAKDALQDSLLQQKRQETVTAYMNFLKQRAQRDGALDVKANALTPG